MVVILPMSEASIRTRSPGLKWQSELPTTNPDPLATSLFAASSVDPLHPSALRVFGWGRRFVFRLLAIWIV